MKEVAAVAGVSLSTVSRAVNEDPSVRFDLRERVRHAIDMLGYRPNLTASALRRAGGATSSIGVLVEDVANPFFAAIQRGIEDVARDRNVLTFAGSTDEVPERERELADAFAARGVDGLLVVPASRDQSYLSRDREAGIGLVFIDRPGRFIDADVVLSDNKNGAYIGVSHLIAAGHRRIAFLGDRENIYTTSERLRGYRDALAEGGVPDDPLLIRNTPLRAVDVYDVTRDLLLAPNPPTAVFSAQNLITIEAVRALHDTGLAHRVAFVGFDDVAMADIVDPGLTVVAQDATDLGTTAAELLFARLDGCSGPSQKVVHAVDLIQRGSGEISPPPT